MGAASYLSLSGEGAAETEVRRSRFLCRVARVETREQVHALVEEERRRHHSAGHHCSAFVLGPDAADRGSSDDGEPSGTAGAPMLEVLTGAGVSDVAAVVSRYFGGVLLGAGGLVRAYGDAVRHALETAPRVGRARMTEVAVLLDHAQSGRVQHELHQQGVLVSAVTYAEGVTVHVLVPVAETEGFAARMRALTSGGAVVTPGASRWVDVPVTAGPASCRDGSGRA